MVSAPTPTEHFLGHVDPGQKVRVREFADQALQSTGGLLELFCYGMPVSDRSKSLSCNKRTTPCPSLNEVNVNMTALPISMTPW